MKVLLVDDEIDIRKIGRMSLERIGGFQAEVAASVAEALLLARQFRPDVILMDMMMPDIDGLAALAMLRAQPDLAAVPVVFLTARVQTSDVRQYIAAGALGVIGKPFDPMTLPTEVRRLLGDGVG